MNTDWWRRAVLAVPYGPALAFGLYAVLALYRHNIGQLGAADLLVPCLIVIVMAPCVWAGAYALLRQAVGAGVLSFFTLALFFSYGHVHQAVQIFRPGWIRHRYLMLAFFVVLGGIGAYSWWRRHRSHDVALQVLAIATATMLVIAGGSILVYEFSDDATSRPPVAGTVLLRTGTQAPPDFFYIILDGYTRTDNLREFYGFNNSEFEEGLTGLGFEILTNSTSNYAFTLLSTASSLNMAYADDLVIPEEGVADKTRSLKDAVYSNEVAETLQQVGYEFVFLHSWVWPGTPRTSSVDVDIHCGQLSEFQALLLRTTIIGPLFDYQNSGEARARIECTFQWLPELSDPDTPRFVFVHILAPHSPFVFGPEGQHVSGFGSLSESFPRSEAEHELEGNLYLGRRDPRIGAAKILDYGRGGLHRFQHGPRVRRARRYCRRLGP